MAILREAKITYTSRRVEGKLTTQLSSSQAVYNLFQELQHEIQEHFVVVCLNVRNKVTAYKTVSIGTIDQGLVRVPEALLLAIMTNSPRVIFIHNHPSGEVSPSKDDILLTQRLKKAAELFDIQVMDHIIIGDGKFYSFLDEAIL